MAASFDDLGKARSLLTKHGNIAYTWAAWLPLDAPIDRVVAFYRPDSPPLAPNSWTAPGSFTAAHGLGWVTDPPSTIRIQHDCCTLPCQEDHGPRPPGLRPFLILLPIGTRQGRLYQSDEINCSIIQLLGQLDHDAVFTFAPIAVFKEAGRAALRAPERGDS